MKANRYFPLLASILLFPVGGAGCTKEVPTGPCEEVSKNFSLSLYEKPNEEYSKFFSRNYKACKKRYLKRNPNALFNVGVSVLHGLGTQKDPMKAFLWFKGAADKEHRGAQRILADMFNDGLGVVQDPLIAKKYLAIAATPPKGL